MKKILLALIILFASACVFAQTAKNPFEKYGYKKQVMFTSSKGEFEEFHDQTDIVEIGSVLFDTKTNKIAGFIDEETASTEIASSTAAMSIDALCEKYYWISPYAYCAGNPIKFVDPDGMMYDWYLNEETGELYFNRDLATETTTVNGEEYSRVGDNNMMGDMGDISEQKYSATASQVVANENGYDIEPTQQFEYNNTSIQFDEVTPHHSMKEEVGTNTVITEKYSIVPYNSSPQVSNITTIKQNASALEVIILLSKKQAFRYNYKYENSPNPVRLDKSSHQINGTGVYRQYYPSWKSYSIETKGKGHYLKYKQ